MKLNLFLVFVFLFSLSTIAQKDVAAKKILDAVSAKVKTFKGISANFTIKSTTNTGKDNGSQTGNFYSKDQKYCIKKLKSEIICDGTKVYNYDGIKTLTISNIEESNQTLTPQNLLSNFYDKDFTYKLISSSGNFHEIELYPIDKRKPFSKVNIFIDKSKNMITKAKIFDKGNNKVEFTLSNLNTSAAINDKMFVYQRSKYPKNIEILD